MSKKLIYDVETNGFLKSMDRIHCLVIRDVTDPDPDKRETYRFRNRPKCAGVRFDGTEYAFEAENTIPEGLAMLEEAAKGIGHNIIDFDNPAIKKVYPKFRAPEALDTLVLARLVWPDTSAMDGKLMAKGLLPGKHKGKHSLDAWGHRLGHYKGDYATICKEKGIEPFAAWNPDLEDYCVNDVELNEVLWEAIARELPPPESIEFEQAIHGLAMKIRENGFPFDKAAAELLAEKLEGEQERLTCAAKARYGEWYAPAKKHIVRPVYEDPDIKKRKTPRQAAEKRALRLKKEFDPSLYQPNGYLKPRAEYGEDFSRAIWGDVTVSKLTQRRKRNKQGKITNPFEWVETPRGIQCKNPDRTEGALSCPLKLVEFNPGSRLHIIDRFVVVHGWTPADFTEGGQPEIDDAILTKLAKPDNPQQKAIPEAAMFADIFFYNKLLGQMKNGKGAWIRKCDEDTGRIHGYINTGGTVSGRCSHNDPNLGQVVSVVTEDVIKKDGSKNKKLLLPNGEFRADCFAPDGKLLKKVNLRGREGEFGVECRSLFYTPKMVREEAWRQLGIDLVNIEGRTLAEQLAPFDKGDLIDALVYQGVDIHDYNLALTGLSDRNLIKRVFFGLIYGAGDLKLGITADPYASEGKQRRIGKELRALIMAKIPALQSAIQKVQNEAKKGYLIGLDGRRLPVRAEYAAFNLRLQSNAALIAKKWALLCEEALIDAGGVHDWTGDFAFLAFVHDELQIAIKAFFAEEAAELCKDAAVRAGEFFNFGCPVAADAKIGSNWYECH